VLAENFWLLVLAPLIIGAIAFGIVSFQHKTFESVAILKPQTVFDEFGNPQGETPASMVARLDSPEVKLAAAEKQRWIRERKLDKTQIVSLLGQAVSAKPDSGSNLVTLRAFGPSPGDAQSLGSALIDTYIQAASPQGTARENILNKIKVAQNALAVLNPAIKVLLSVDEATGEVDTDLAVQPASRPALADLVSQRTTSELAIRALNNSLKITMQDIVIQAPTLNEKAVKPKRLQLTAMAVILSGLALVVVVFVRAALRAAAQDPEGAPKIARIRKGILRF